MQWFVGKKLRIKNMLIFIIHTCQSSGTQLASTVKEYEHIKVIRTANRDKVVLHKLMQNRQSSHKQIDRSGNPSHFCLCSRRFPMSNVNVGAVVEFMSILSYSNIKYTFLLWKKNSSSDSTELMLPVNSIFCPHHIMIIHILIHSKFGRKQPFLAEIIGCEKMPVFKIHVMY